MMAQTLPENWTRSTVAKAATVIMGQSPDSHFVNEEEVGIPFLQGNAEFTEKHPVPVHWVTKPTKLSEQGDILISVRAPVGEINISDKEYCIGRGLAAIRFREVDKHFGWYTIAYHKDQLSRLAQGSTFTAVSAKDFSDFEIIYPDDPTEQRTIADILCAMDESIAQSESLLRKYQSIKQGLMSDLLMRGVDENGELRNPEKHEFKDSEIGRIPSEWGVATLRQVTASATDGPFGSNLKTEHYQDDGVRVVRLQNIGEGVFDNTDKAFISEEHASQLSKFEVHSGDLLIAAMGDENHLISRACLYPNYLQPGIVKADCFRFKLDPRKAINAYVMWILCCPDTRVDLYKLGQGVTRDRINLKNTQTIRLRIPPVEEQKIIVDMLNAQQALLENVNDQLAKLQLLKQGLMQDLLRGQVRVKE